MKEFIIETLLRDVFAPDPTDRLRYGAANHQLLITRTAEGRLWCAVLERSIVDLLRPTKKEHHYEALKWITARDTGHIESFDYVCALLKLDGAAVRKRLLERLAARGGSKGVLAPAKGKRAPKLKGTNLCQHEDLPAERLSVLPPARPADLTGYSVTTADCANSITPIDAVGTSPADGRNEHGFNGDCN